MADISNYANVIIDRQTTAITVAGFGLPLFLGLHKGFTERYKEYGSLAEVGADFATTSNEYKAAQSFFGQEISINKIAIGRQNSTTATLTPVVADNTVYSVVINGVTFSFTSGVAATATTITTGINAAINAGTEPVTASGTTTTVLTADVGGVPFSVKPSSNFTVVYATTESLTDALTAVQLESNDFYGVTAYTHVKADQLEIAAWTQSNDKLYGTSSNDANIVNQTAQVDTTSIATALKAAGYFRTFVLYSAEAAKYPEAAWFGGELAKQPGSSQFMYKQLAGITADKLTEGQRSNALAKNANIYITTAGVNMTENGKTSEGEWIDIIRDTDYFKSQLQVVVFSRLVNIGKIKYTDKDIAIIEAEIRAETLRAVDDGILANDPAPIIFVPKVKDIPINDRANRILPDITVTARIAGAVLYVNPITVTITV